MTTLFNLDPRWSAIVLVVEKPPDRLASPLGNAGAPDVHP
jgi:hypothetical protein